MLGLRDLCLIGSELIFLLREVVSLICPQKSLNINPAVGVLRQSQTHYTSKRKGL